MKKILSVIFIWLSLLANSYAEEVVNTAPVVDVVLEAVTPEEKLNNMTATTPTLPVEAKAAPVEVGKHVTANMDAMSMILSLLMVLVVIVIKTLPGCTAQYQRFENSHELTSRC